jgi:hypothetical protein
MYAANEGAWRRTEPLFAHFYRLLDSASIPIKETVLVTVGAIGK